MSDNIDRNAVSDVEDLATAIIECAYNIHSALGPGLDKGAYEEFLYYELERKSIPFETQVEVPLYYKDKKLDQSVTVDLMIDDSLMVDVKAVDSIEYTDRASILTGVRLSGKKFGLLLNFNTVDMKEGIIRVPN